MGSGSVSNSPHHALHLRALAIAATRCSGLLAVVLAAADSWATSLCTLGSFRHISDAWSFATRNWRAKAGLARAAE